MNSDAYYGICVWLFEIGSTCYSECDSRCNEQVRVGEPLILRVRAAASRVLAAAGKLEM